MRENEEDRKVMRPEGKREGSREGSREGGALKTAGHVCCLRGGRSAGTTQVAVSRVGPAGATSALPR